MQKLGKNLGRYFGETIDIRSVLGDVEGAARDHGWKSGTFHEAAGFQWTALARTPSNATPQTRRVYLSAGIHGDEPAGPLAVLRLLKEDRWPGNLEFHVCPCLNPVGFTLNQRENADGKDLNRDYLHLETAEVRAHVAWLKQQPAFDLCLCLHEDWESLGFYMYEVNPDQQASLAEAMVTSVAKVCPVDQSDVIEGRPAKGGIIRPNIDPRTRPQWPEAFWLIMNKTRISYTLEAPSDFSLETRVNALTAAVHTALREWKPVAR